MEGNKIVTAKKFAEKHSFERNNGGTAIHTEDAEEILIEFAKLHVTQALKAASQNADAYNKPKFEGDINPVVDLDSILNAYPLDLIK